MTRLTPDDGIVFLTGAGSGLGRALAIGLTAQGFTVVGTGRRLAALEETQTLANRGLFHPHAADMSDPVAVQDAVDSAQASYGPVALLINNAAVYPRRDFLDESAQSFLDTVLVNLGGTVACTRAVLDGMVGRGRGRILNVATFADLNPIPASSAYSVSKGAARIFSRALVSDLGDRFPDIVISDWMPGMLKTSMGVDFGLPPDEAARWGIELALRTDRDLNGAVFEQGTEILPPRGLKGKLKDAVLGRRRRPRQL